MRHVAPLLAAALLGACTTPGLPDQAKHPRAYERATGGQFVCDDHPERCGQPWSVEDYWADGQPAPASARYETKAGRAIGRVCGPEGPARNPDPPTPVVAGPSCHRDGWNGQRYTDFCEGRKRYPAADDPWVLAFQRLRGETLKNAQISVSDNRINGCD